MEDIPFEKDENFIIQKSMLFFKKNMDVSKKNYIYDNFVS